MVIHGRSPYQIHFSVVKMLLCVNLTCGVFPYFLTKSHRLLVQRFLRLGAPVLLFSLSLRNYHFFFSSLTRAVVASVTTILIQSTSHHLSSEKKRGKRKELLCSLPRPASLLRSCCFTFALFFVVVQLDPRAALFPRSSVLSFPSCLPSSFKLQRLEKQQQQYKHKISQHTLFLSSISCLFKRSILPISSITFSITLNVLAFALDHLHYYYSVFFFIYAPPVRISLLKFWSYLF